METQYLKIIFLISTIAFISCNDKVEKSRFSNIESDGAWLLYSMNFYSGDSTAFKEVFPDKKYIDILSMDFISILRDTVSDKKIIHSYSCFSDNKMSSKNILQYHSVEFDSNEIKKVFVDDLIELNINKNAIVYYDSLLLNLMNDKKNVKFSRILMNAYENRMHH